MIVQDTFAAMCGIDPAAMRSGMLLALVLAGAAGSLVHCVPMCGPLVLGQVADRMACLSAGCLTAARRVRAGLLLPYHAGRVTTYGLLGAAAGAVGTLAAAGFQPIAGGLLLLAAVLFLRQAIRRARGRREAPAAAAGWGRALARVGARLDRTHPLGSYALGLVLGLLPCGFVYAALAAAATAGGAGAGAVAMVAFGLGTVPALAAVGVAGGALGGRWQSALGAVTPWILGANAVLLAAVGVQALAG